MIQDTLILIKPDCVRRRMVGQIISAIESRGLNIIKINQKQLTESEASELYKEHRGKWHFSRNIRHITSGPVVAIHVHSHNAVKICRDIVERCREAHKDIITLPQNLVHATSDPEKALDELAAVGYVEIALV